MTLAPQGLLAQRGQREHLVPRGPREIQVLQANLVVMGTRGQVEDRDRRGAQVSQASQEVQEVLEPLEPLVERVYLVQRAVQAQ